MCVAWPRASKCSLVTFPAELEVYGSLLHHNLRQWLSFLRIFSRMGCLFWLLETLKHLSTHISSKAMWFQLLLSPSGFGYEFSSLFMAPELFSLLFLGSARYFNSSLCANWIEILVMVYLQRMFLTKNTIYKYHFR